MNERPKLTHMAKGMALTMYEWAMAGSPLRAREEIVEIFQTHCRPCEFYNEGRNVLGKPGFCERCGCHVSEDPDSMLNKIRNPLVSCPLDPPRWRCTIEYRKSDSKPRRKS